MNRSPRISFVSLGCPKALVDSERIITRLRAEGYELTREHSGAETDHSDRGPVGRGRTGFRFHDHPLPEELLPDSCLDRSLCP